MSYLDNERPKEFYPLATNILKLQYYSNFFDLTEIVMFDWFIVKARAFKYKQFFYSKRRISEEVRIRDDRLSTIIGRFIEKGIIQVEVKGMPKQHHFTVDFEQIILLIPQVFQLTGNSELLPEKSELYAFFNKLLTESSLQKKYNKKDIIESKEETLRKEMTMVVGKPTTEGGFLNLESKFSLKEDDEALGCETLKRAEEATLAKKLRTEQLESILVKTYAERVAMYNNEQEKGERVKRAVKLSFKHSMKEKLFELGQLYDDDQIRYSFAAYVDSSLRNDIEVSKLIPYFLHRRPVTQDFDTFHTFLNRFVMNYSSEKA